MKTSVLQGSDVLRQWLGDSADEVTGIDVGVRRPLVGGWSSPLVERVEVLAAKRSGHCERHDLVVKRATHAEVLALREVAAVPDAEAFPELIDDGCDEDGHWVVMPYYPGAPLAANSELPDAVYASLARLHVRHLGRTTELPPEYARIDFRFCADTLGGFAVSGIRQAQRVRPHPVYTRALEVLPQWADDPRMRAGVELLPATLLHGDVYGANVLVDAGGPPRLVDWGNARVGPPMFDVAMSADIGSVGFAAYLRAWEAASGEPMDPWEAEAGHAWTTALSHAMFVGTVAEKLGPEAADAMLLGAEAGLRRFGELLDARCG